MFEPDIFGEALPVLSGRRIVLRAPRPTDAQGVLEIFGDPKAMRYWSHEPLADLHAAEKYLLDNAKDYSERSSFEWVISDASQKEFLGTVTLFRWSQEHRRVELGYMLAPSHWGQGLAQEAVGLIIRFAFGVMKVHRIEADIDPRNIASAKLLLRLGFREEGLCKERWFTYGEWSDTAFYGLLNPNS